MSVCLFLPPPTKIGRVIVRVAYGYRVWKKSSKLYIGRPLQVSLLTIGCVVVISRPSASAIDAAFFPSTSYFEPVI